MILKNFGSILSPDGEKIFPVISVNLLPDQRGAGHVEAFQFLSVRMSECLSECPDIKLQGLSLALRSHDQFQASHWMMDDG